MGFIYKITNKINNKIYIGKTKKSVEQRYKRHIISSRNPKTYLHYSMNKYGVNNFCVEIIEEVKIDELNNREKHWIEFYKSNNRKNGYNCTAGGDGNNQIDNYIIMEMNKLWDEGFSITEISKKLCIYNATVKQYLEKYCNTFSREEQKRRGISGNSEKHSKKVLQFDLNGNYMTTYCNISEAIKRSGICRERIIGCCKKVIPNADSYQFAFEGDEKIGKCKKPIFVHKPVCQKDLSGNIIAMYISASEAGRELKVNSSCIRRCCYKDKKTCKGYVWDFISEIEYLEYVHKSMENVQLEHIKSVV